MAVNPLYKNEYYFFSGMYDDSLITDFYRKITSESYDRSVLYQHNMLGRKRHFDDRSIFHKSTVSDLIVDNNYNRQNNLPDGTRTLKFNRLILPIFNNRKFYSVYGLVKQRVPIIDFYKRNDIFDKTIILQIGNCRIIDASFICNDDKSVTLVIENSVIDKFISDISTDEVIWIFSDEITQVYFSETTSTDTFLTDAKDGFYEVKIPVSKAINKIGTSVVHDVANSWDCLISYKTNRYSKKLLASYPVALKGIDSENAIFYINSTFVDSIKSNSHNINIYFIHRPNRKHILMYQYSNDTSPILSLDYTYNPSGNINIEVYELDMQTMCKGRKLYDPEFTQVYFPNIFDFNKLNKNNSDLMIEITEYYPTYTNQVMTNSLTPLIDSLGPEFYTEFVVNKYDKSISGLSCNLQNYHPTHYPVSLEDYMNSEYYGNYRGYMLDKIAKTINSDPYLLAYYYRWMNDKNKMSISVSGTPKYMKFGTGHSGEFGGSHEIVTDTKFITKNIDEVFYFDEPHSYMTYHTFMKDSPSTVFVNGKYVRPTYSKSYNGLTYLFFPTSMIEYAMDRYFSDDHIIAASPITIDIYPKSYNSQEVTPISKLNPSSMEDAYKIFQDIDKPEFSISELVVYNETTGEYLGKLNDIFNISLSVSNYIIENPEASESIAMALECNVNKLLTIINQIYCTKDNIPIIVSSTDIKLSWNDFIDDLLNNGVITTDEISAFTHKRLNFKNIEISLKDYSLIGANIAIYSTNFKDEKTTYSNYGSYDSINDKSVYYFIGANVDPDMNKYLVYADGKLIHDAQVSANSNIHNGDLTVSIPGVIAFDDDKEILLVHMPIEYYREPFSTTSKVFYMKNGLSTGTDIPGIWPDTTSDGLILQYYGNRIFNGYPFEDCHNIKYSSDGLRIPPTLKSTNRLYGEYLSNIQIKNFYMYNNDLGYVYFINNDMPFIDLAKQNPFSQDCDTSLPMNPLDILTHF